jgi:CRP-like cAMP-binding protein
MDQNLDVDAHAKFGRRSKHSLKLVLSTVPSKAQFLRIKLPFSSGKIYSFFFGTLLPLPEIRSTRQPLSGFSIQFPRKSCRFSKLRGVAVASAGQGVRKKSRLQKPVALKSGMRTDGAGKSVRNIVLLSIPDSEYELIRPHLEPVELPHHFVLHDVGEKIGYAYFPNDGMTSLVVTTKDGRSVEVGIAGREGVVGTPLAVGMNRGPYLAIQQIPGSGLRVKSEVLEDVLILSPSLHLELGRYALIQGIQVAQIAACNRLHEIDQRLARWLLMCQDRVDSEVLFLTHEFLADMLGAGRPSVTLAAGILQRAGLIVNDRGTIRIINRKGLEEAACECYNAIQNLNGGLGLK